MDDFVVRARGSSARLFSEQRATSVIFLIYAIIQVHALWLHGYSGQDFISHKSWIDQAAIDPWGYLTHYAPGRTNPPLYHFIGGILKRVLGANRYVFALGAVNVVMSLIGACCVYAVVRRLIHSPVLRVAAILFLLFLPVHVIHAEVIASDAMATPLFWILLWLLVRFSADASWGSFCLSLSAIGLVLIIGFFVKFTFAFVALACWIWVFSLWWTKRLTGQKLAATVLVVGLAPSLCILFGSVRFWSETNNTWNFSPKIDPAGAAMTPRSLLWLRAGDVDVLSAPPYNRRVNGAYDLLINNKHSYPALAQLAIFTDILNIYQFDPYDYYFGARTKRNHHRMQVAARAGISFSLLTAVAVIILSFKSTLGIALRRYAGMELFTTVLLSLAWAFPIVGGMLFVSAPYNSGFWLPRLAAPAILGFFMLGFAFLDSLPQSWRKARVAVLVIVIAQSALHVSFLWPSESNQAFYEPNADVDLAAHLNGAVYRVFSWQDAYFQNEAGKYWLDGTLGIVLNRPSTASGDEIWNLSFVARDGPSHPAGPTILQVRSKRLAPQLMQFDGVGAFEIKVPLAPGRNDIHVELVSPPAVEAAADPLIRMAQVSQIKVTRDGRSATLLWPN